MCCSRGPASRTRIFNLKKTGTNDAVSGNCVLAVLSYVGFAYSRFGGGGGGGVVT